MIFTTKENFVDAHILAWFKTMYNMKKGIKMEYTIVPDPSMTDEEINEKMQEVVSIISDLTESPMFS